MSGDLEKRRVNPTTGTCTTMQPQERGFFSFPTPHCFETSLLLNGKGGATVEKEKQW